MFRPHHQGLGTNETSISTGNEKQKRNCSPGASLGVTWGWIAWATTRIYNWSLALQSLGDSICIGIPGRRSIRLLASGAEWNGGIRTSLHFPLLYIDHSPRHASTYYSFIIVPHITHAMQFRSSEWLVHHFLLYTRLWLWLWSPYHPGVNYTLSNWEEQSFTPSHVGSHDSPRIL